MSEKLCVFCQHFRWEEESMWGMGSTLTGPMMEGGDATCGVGRFQGKWDNRPRDEDDWRQIILRGMNCEAYSPVAIEEPK